MPRSESYRRTPDGRYFVVRGRLWRLTNPNLDEAARQRLVHALMAARRAVHQERGTAPAVAAARLRVNAAKQALGERRPVWWTDGSLDLNRHMVATPPYANWFAALPNAGRTAPPRNAC